MPPHLAPLYRRYNAILNPIPRGTVFDRHWFIAKLTRSHQRDYINALNHYAGGRGPFMTLHRLLSTRLHSHSQVVHIGTTFSNNIFGQDVSNAQWRRV